MSNIIDIGRKKWWAIGAISLGAIAFSLDLNVLSLALPTLAKAIHASTTQLQWIVDAYSLVLSVFLLPAGLLGDRYGRKKWMIIALSLFGLASVACAYATTAGQLIAARMVLGFAGAFILPLALSVLPVFFTDEERPKAVAFIMGSVFLATPLGPILGGWLLSHYWWGSVFLINIPIIALALTAVATLLPETRSPRRPKIDSLGILLSGIGISGLTYGAIQAQSSAWSSHSVIAALVGGAVALAGFVLWERRTAQRGEQPLVDLRLFKSAGFTWGSLLATGVTFVMFGLLFSLPQFFQSVVGKSALQSGIRLLPMVGGLLVGSIVSGGFARKLGTKVTVALGFVSMGVGLLIGTHMNVQASDAFIATWTGIMGLGLGFAMPSAVDAAVGSLSAENGGVGSALVQTLRQVGGTLGVAILGTVLGASYHHALRLNGLPQPVQHAVTSSVTSGVAVAKQLHSPSLLQSVQHAFVHGMNTTFWIGVGIAGLSVLLSVAYLPNKPRTAAGKSGPAL